MALLLQSPVRRDGSGAAWDRQGIGNHRALEHAPQPRRRDGRHHDGRLKLAVADDGDGLPARVPAASSTGLRSIEARARTLGGTVTYVSEPGAGTRIELDAPLAGGELSPEARRPR